MATRELAKLFAPGRSLEVNSIAVGKGKYRIEMKNVSKGLYLLHLESSHGISVVKLAIN